MEDMYVTVPRGSYDSLESTLSIPTILEAPVAQGQPLADINVSLNGQQLVKRSLRALSDNPSGSFWQRTKDGVSLWFE
jgi:D-alanyl-D-alanine carboxypeptidase (penicillin-binding protein 5/6)